MTAEGTTTYAYDALHRLTEVCVPPGCVGSLGNLIRYTYDEVGNRLSETHPLGATAYTYNNADQLTAAAGLLGTTSYAYDPNGNEIQAGARTFPYELANPHYYGPPECPVGYYRPIVGYCSLYTGQP